MEPIATKTPAEFNAWTRKTNVEDVEVKIAEYFMDSKTKDRGIKIHDLVVSGQMDKDSFAKQPTAEEYVETMSKSRND